MPGSEGQPIVDSCRGLEAKSAAVLGGGAGVLMSLVKGQRRVYHSYSLIDMSNDANEADGYEQLVLLQAEFYISFSFRRFP